MPESVDQAAEKEIAEGGCLCGAVRFRAASFSAGIFKCHCSQCRKAFGGASSAAAVCPAEAFSWLQGEQNIKEFRTESGFLRRFCTDCGSLLPQYLEDWKAYWVPAGLLESHAGLELRQHIYVDSKAPWEVLDEQTPRLDEGFA